MKRTQKKWLGTGVLSSAVRRGAKHAVFLATLVASASAAFGAACQGLGGCQRPSHPS